MKTVLIGIANGFKASDILPPEDSPQIINKDNDKWGCPIQYSYENNIPTLRSAGVDGKLNTDDDITQEVDITIESELKSQGE